MAHEAGEPRNLLIATIGIGTIVVLVAVMYGMQSYFHVIRGEEQQAKIFGRPNPELLDLRAKEDHTLSSYALLDKAQDHVRIPIDRAMSLLVQRGRDGVPSIQPEASASAPVTTASTVSTAAPSASSSAATPLSSAAAPAVKMGSAGHPKNIR